MGLGIVYFDNKCASSQHLT